MEKNVFDVIRHLYDKENIEREKVIQDSREINALSKKVIYSLHREDIDSADKSIIELKKKVNLLIEVYGNTKNSYSGSYKVAIQEYIEAMAYFYFVKKGELFQTDLLGIENKENLNNLNNLNNLKHDIDMEHYILGLCDLSGELVRKALNDGISGNYESVFKIQKFLSNLFNELAQIDFRNGEIRKKVDSLRWDLRKIEEMAFSLKIK
jgi:predicted translin family RNA/ssDNA-binding protein